MNSTLVVHQCFITTWWIIVVTLSDPYALFQYIHQDEYWMLTGPLKPWVVIAYQK